MTAGRSEVYTLGTSTRSAPEFLALLKDFGIQTVVDVRRFPTSRFEHFGRERLSQLLRKALINYIYLGHELGGYRPGGYPAFTSSPQFQQGLDRLEEVAKEEKVAIICAERFPWHCHRRFIAQKLEERGWRVVHIIDRGQVWIPREGR
jgi:uncharacterized protein (DUF488 family)